MAVTVADQADRTDHTILIQGDEDLRIGPEVIRHDAQLRPKIPGQPRFGVALLQDSERAFVVPTRLQRRDRSPDLARLSSKALALSLVVLRIQIPENRDERPCGLIDPSLSARRFRPAAVNSPLAVTRCEQEVL